MIGKIVGVKRECVMCGSRFQPLSHNHVYCKKCKAKYKELYYQRYNEEKRVEVDYKFTHKVNNNNTISREQARKRKLCEK